MISRVGYGNEQDSKNKDFLKRIVGIVCKCKQNTSNWSNCKKMEGVIGAIYTNYTTDTITTYIYTVQP